MTLAHFYDKGKVLVSKHFLTIKVMLFVITPENNFRSLGPIPSNPVDLDKSSFDIKEKTKFSSISGNSNLTFSWIFELTNSVSFVKSGCVIGSFNLDAMFTKNH